MPGTLAISCQKGKTLNIIKYKIRKFTFFRHLPLAGDFLSFHRLILFSHHSSPSINSKLFAANVSRTEKKIKLNLVWVEGGFLCYCLREKPFQKAKAKNIFVVRFLFEMAFYYFSFYILLLDKDSS